jgi:PAS domain S-box-containing protein
MLEEYKRLVEEQGQALLEVIQSVALGELDVTIEIPEGVEVFADLAIGLEMMVDDIRALLADVERRGRDLQTAAEVSRVASSILDPDKLIQQVVDLVCERFDLYYAGLFLVDQDGEWTGEPGRWAVLRAGIGEAGQQMIAQGHKLEIGGNSMIGACVADHQARIASDVGEEAVYFDNPFLPETHSEMALPLVARGRAIGALTVQSQRIAAFSGQDVTVLQTVADQVATAIANADLFEQTQEALREAGLFRQLVGASGQGIGIANLEGEIVYVNPTLSRFLGVANPEDLLGKTFASYYPEAMQRMLQDEIMPIVQKEGQWVGELALVSATGDTIPTIENFFLIRDEQSRPRYVADIVTDLSVRKQTELMLAQRVKELDCLNDIGRKIDQDPPVKSFLRWVAERIPPAMQHPDKCRVAVEYKGQTFGAADAVKLPRQMVGGLRVSDERVGRIIIAYTEDYDFLDQESALLGDVARRVSGYVEKQHLFEEIQARAHRETALRQVVATVSASEDIAASLPNILEHLRELVPVDMLTLAAFVPDENELTLLGAATKTQDGTHFTQAGMRLPLDSSDSGWVVKHGDPWLETDMRMKKTFDADGGLVAAGMVSRCLLPLRVGAQVIGAINLASTRPGAFTEAHLPLLSQVASQVALALERTRLMEEMVYTLTDLEARSTELQAAAEVSRIISTILDPDELIQRLVDLAHDQFDLYYAGLFLVDHTGEWTGEPGRWAVLRAGTGEAGHQMVTRGHKLEIGGSSMIGTCVAEKASRISLDVGEEAVRFDNPFLPETRSELALPLVARGQALGAMSIQSTRESAFTEENITALQTLADQVATAIQNGLLYQKSNMLYEASQAVAQAQDMEKALENVARYVLAPFYDACALVTFPEPISQDEEGGFQPADAMQVSAVWAKQADAVPMPVGTTISQRHFPLFDLITLDQATVIFEDLAQDSRLDPALAQQLAATGMRSALSVPLIAGPNWLGLLLAQGARPAKLRQEDQQAIESLANRLAAFVQASSSLQETRQALEEVQQVQRRYIRESWRDYLLGAPASDVTDYLLDQQQLVSNPRLDRPEASLALQHNRTVTSNMVDTYKRQSPEDGERASNGDARSTVVVPISLRGQVIGMLGLEDLEGQRIWTEDEIAMIEAISTQLGLAIDNARLSEQTQATLAETARLYEATSRLANANSAEEVIEVLTQEIASALGSSSSGNVLLVGPDPTGDVEWMLEAGQWNPGENVPPVGTRLSLQHYPEWNRFIGHRETFVTRLEDLPPQAKQVRELMERIASRFITSIPLMAGDSWLGLINVHGREDHPLDASATRFLRSLADRAAVALESLRLYGETRKRAEREQMIRQITDRVRASASLETILQTTVQELSQAMGLPRVFVRLGTKEELTTPGYPTNGDEREIETLEGTVSDERPMDSDPSSSLDSARGARRRTKV